jgi:hypothetical protein
MFSQRSKSALFYLSDKINEQKGSVAKFKNQIQGL